MTNAARRRRVRPRQAHAPRTAGRALCAGAVALFALRAGAVTAQTPAPAPPQALPQALPQAPAPGAAQATTTASADLPRDSAPPAGAERAVIAAGDRLRVKVWREPGLTDEYVVDERGDVVLPRLGTLRVGGRSVAGVRDTLVSRYAEYLRNPSVDVTALRRIGVQGEVRAPNLYYVDLTKSVRDVITEAGGVLDTGNRDGVAILRDGQRIPIPHWQTGGSVSGELHSGDQIVVPRRSWWSINALAVVSTLGVVVPVGLSLLSYVRK